MTGPRHNRTWFWLSAGVLALFCLFLLYPLFQVIASSISASQDGRSGWVTLVSEPRYRSAVVNTLLLGVVVTLTSTLIGVPLAFFTARFSFPGKALIALLPMTTLIVPEVIAAQTWLMVLGNNGFLTRWLGDHGIDLPSFYGWLGLITVITRGFFLLSARPWTLPHWAQRGLQYAPIAALSAVVLPEIVTSHGQLVQTWMDARLFAAAAGAAYFFWRKGVLGTIVTGMLVYLPLHVGLGW